MAALYEQRHAKAEALQRVARPRTETDERNPCRERAIVGIERDAIASDPERQRVPAQDRAALLPEQVRLGVAERAGVFDPHRLRPNNGPGEAFGEVTLRPLQRVPVKHLERDAEPLADRLVLGRTAGQRFPGAIEAKVAALAPLAEGGGLFGKPAIGGDGLAGQQRHGGGRGKHAGRGARAEEADQRGGRLKNVAPSKARVGAAAGEDAEDHRKVAGKCVGHHGFRLDETRVAVGRLARGLLAVDDGDRKATLLQCERGAEPDHSGAENEGVERTGHEPRSSAGAAGAVFPGRLSLSKRRGMSSFPLPESFIITGAQAPCRENGRAGDRNRNRARPPCCDGARPATFGA